MDANVNLNEQIVSAIDQKRSRDKINQKYLWHHKLGHIRKDRINKLKKNEIFALLIQSCIQLMNLTFEVKWPSYPL